jgi:hypothetical protein
MTNILNWILTWLGHLSVIVSICCFAWYGVMQVAAFASCDDERILVAEDSVWLGFSYFGLWLACQVGILSLKGLLWA